MMRKSWPGLVKEVMGNGDLPFVERDREIVKSYVKSQIN
jgi:hypothetical protein